MDIYIFHNCGGKRNLYLFSEMIVPRVDFYGWCSFNMFEREVAFCATGW